MSVFNWKFNGQSQNKGLAGFEVQEAHGVISNAQLLAMNTTPVVLVPNPTLGYYISVGEVLLTLNFGTIAFTGNNNMEFHYTNGSGVQPTAAAPYSWVQSGSSAAYKVIESTHAPVGGDNLGGNTGAIVAYTPSANWAAGDSTISYSVSYRKVKLP